MSPQRSRAGKLPKSYKEDSSSDSESDDDFELPRKKATPKSTKKGPSKNPCSSNGAGSSRGSKGNPKEKASKPKDSGAKKDVKKNKKNQQNKENIPKGNGNVPWINRQPLTPKNHLGNLNSCQLLHFLSDRSFGTMPTYVQEQSLNVPLMNVNQRLQVYKTYMEFDRRITAMEWHPKSQNIVVVAAKSGDIVLWDYENEKKLAFIEGTGANGSIQAMKFDYRSSNLIYTASVNGTVCCHDLTGRREEHAFLNTMDLNHWYTSLDLLDKHTLMVGDNKGVATMLTTDGNILWQEKLHKQKITHLECCPSNSNYVISGSVDRSMKVWDIRNMKSQKSCLYMLEHEAPINSAYFSSSGNCVLTTDQKKELRVYAGPSFALMQIIPHPHRHFQHLTPIKAIWHPLRDIIIVGRYPDPDFPTYSEGELKSIDFFDAASGKLLHQHVTRDLSNKIVSLNLFNRSGDQMLSAAGMCAFLWRPKFPLQSKSKETDKKGNDDDDDDDDDDNDSDDDKDFKNKKKKARGEKRKELKVSREKLKKLKN